MELAANDAELREKLAADHAEKMKDISGVGAWERELEALQDKYKTEEELETERYAIQLEQLQEFLENKFVTEEEYRKMSLDAEAAHAKEMSRIAEERAKREEEVEQSIRNMRMQTVQMGINALSMFAGKSRAFAIAQIALNKGLAIAQIAQNTAAAVMKTMAIYGATPQGFAAVSAVKTMGAIQAGLVAATGIGEIMSSGGSGGGSVSAGYSSNSYTTSSGGTTTAEQTVAGRSLTLYGFNKSSLYSGEEIAKLLNEYVADGGVIYMK